MSNENSDTAIQALPLALRQASHGATRVRRRLPAIARCIIIAPLTMALLGAEIELHISPQLDLFLTAAGVWCIWTWLRK